MISQYPSDYAVAPGQQRRLSVSLHAEDQNPQAGRIVYQEPTQLKNTSRHRLVLWNQKQSL